MERCYNTGMESITISRLEASDLGELADVARRTYCDAFADGLSAEDLQQHLQQTRSVDYFKAAMKTDVILLAKNDGHTVGYVQFGAVKIDGTDAGPDDRELGRIYVETSLQHHGIGRQLMKVVLDCPDMRAAPKIYVQVFDQNIKAIGLYKKYGFHTIGTTRFKVGDTELEDLIMVRDNSVE